MKLVVGKLPKNLKGPLLISVDYDPNDDGECQKNYTKDHAQGVPFEVSDEVGSAIVGKYPKIVKLHVPGQDSGVKEPGKNKMQEGPGKTA